MVEDTITMAMWEAYEEEWRLHPTVDDLAAWYLEHKPPAKAGAVAEKDPNVMGPLDFMAFVKATGGTKLGPGAL